LGRIGMPASVVAMLRSSATFMAMAKTLDSRYVSIWDPALNIHRRLNTSADGVVLPTSSFAGRRVLNVEESSTGSMFETFTSPDNTGLYDAIRVKKPDPADTLSWVEVIAHETGHAFNFVTRPSPSVTMADRIRDAISDEIATRQIENTVVLEIMRTTAGARQLAGQTRSTGSTNRPIVERDFFPTPQRRTNLEHFVLMELIRAAINREGLSDTQMKAKDKEVQDMDLKGWRARTFTSDYSRFRFWLRVIDFRWRRLEQLHRPGTRAFERVKEIVLQENANAFFGGLVRYTPRPEVRKRRA